MLCVVSWSFIFVTRTDHISSSFCVLAVLTHFALHQARSWSLCSVSISPHENQTQAALSVGVGRYQLCSITDCGHFTVSISRHREHRERQSQCISHSCLNCTYSGPSLISSPIVPFETGCPDHTTQGSSAAVPLPSPRIAFSSHSSSRENELTLKNAISFLLRMAAPCSRVELPRPNKSKCP